MSIMIKRLIYGFFIAGVIFKKKTFKYGINITLSGKVNAISLDMFNIL